VGCIAHLKLPFSHPGSRLVGTLEFALLRAEPALECSSGAAAFAWACPEAEKAVAALPHSKARTFGLRRFSLVAQVSSGKANKDVLQAGLASSKAQQVRATFLQGRQQGGDGLVSFTHTQHDPPVFHMDRLDTRE